MSPPSDQQPGGQPLFTHEEFADLLAGALSAEQQADLRRRIDLDPETAAVVLDDLAAVDKRFPDPPHVESPLEVPPETAARWEAAVAREAQRRAQEGDGATGHAVPPTE